MIGRKLGRPSPAMAIACLALFVAIGGTGYAAITLPKDSVGSKQIRKGAVKAKKIAKGAVTNKKLRRDAVTGAKVKGGSLDSSDFAAGTLLQGPRGFSGVNGAATVTYRTFLANFAGNNTLGEAEASCNLGEKLIGGGGGWVSNNDPPGSYVLSGTLSDSGPALSGDVPIAEGQTPSDWHVSGKNTTGVNARMLAYAICATP